MSRFRLSLQNRILVYIVLAAGGSGLLATFYAYYQSMAPLEATSGRVFQGVASESASVARETVEHHVEECRILSMLPPFADALDTANRTYAGLDRTAAAALLQGRRALSAGDGSAEVRRQMLDNEVSRHLRRFAQGETQASEHLLVALLDRQGEVIGASTRPKAYYFGDSDWFQQVGRQHETIVDAAVSPSDSPVNNVFDYTFQVSYPIKNAEGKVVGTILMVHPTKIFLKRYSQIRMGKSGHTMLFDSSGQMLFCPILGIRNHRSRAALIAETNRDRVGWTTSLNDVHFPGRRSIVAFAPIRLDEGTRIASPGGQSSSWFIVTSQDPGETYSYLNGLLRKGIGGSAIVLVTLLLFGYILSRRLTTPIAELRKGAAAIGSGKLDYRLDIKTGDEIEDLAEQFNEMAINLQESENRLKNFNSKLEKEVARRTFELSFLSLVPSAVNRHSDPETMIEEILAGIRVMMDMDIAHLDISMKTLSVTSAAVSSPALSYPGWEKTCRDTLAVPIRIQQQSVGRLVLGTVGRQGIDGQKKRLVRLISKDLERAIENIVLARDTQRLATTDALTGLHNRREFQRLLQGELERAERYSESFSLLLIDVDGFKATNDSRGHLFGDEILVSLAEILQDEARAYDFCCRFGGDEFCVCLPGASQESARGIAQRLRMAFASANPAGTEIRSGQGGLTLSIGMATYPADGSTQQELLGAADAALYYSKFTGGNSESIANDAAHDLKDLRLRDPLGWRDSGNAADS